MPGPVASKRNAASPKDAQPSAVGPSSSKWRRPLPKSGRRADSTPRSVPRSGRPASGRPRPIEAEPARSHRDIIEEDDAVLAEPFYKRHAKPLLGVFGAITVGLLFGVVYAQFRQAPPAPSQ